MAPTPVTFPVGCRRGRARCPPQPLQETSLFSKLQLQETQDAKSLPNNSCHHSIQPRTMRGPRVQGPRGTGVPIAGMGSAPPPPQLPARTHAATSSPPPPPHPWGGPISFFFFPSPPPFISPFAVTHFPLQRQSSWVAHGWVLCKASHQLRPPQGHPAPTALPGRVVKPASQGDTRSGDPAPTAGPTFPSSTPAKKGNLSQAGTPMTLRHTNPAPMPRLTSPCWERMEHPGIPLRSTWGGCTPFHPKDKGKAATPLVCWGVCV